MRIPVYVIDCENGWHNPMLDHAKASLRPAPVVRFGESETIMSIEVPDCYRVEKWCGGDELALYHLCEFDEMGGAKPELVVDENGHSCGEVHFWWFRGNRRDLLSLPLVPYMSTAA